MTKMKLKLGVAGSVLLLSAGAVQAQEACTSYTVVPGDSLSGIARSAYGDISFQQIWDANRSKIGRNPNSIAVGMTLELPCADGTLASASTTETAAPVEDVAVVEDSTPTSSRRVDIKLVTGDDYAPYTDEDAAGGGVITELLRQALATVETDADTSITFINDWGSHMEVLLPSGAFDGTFPWVAPDCEATDLDDNFQARCDNFRFSEPVYEIVTGLIAPIGDPLATTASFSDFEGKTICIPESYGVFVMPSGGISEDAVTYSNPKTPEACFEELMAGTVDVIEMEVRQAADIAKTLDLSDKIAVNDQISAAVALTVVVDKGNPDADAILDAINVGIENIRGNGVWFQTVQAGFQAYYGE